LGGFAAEPGQVQQGSGKVLEKVWEALVQSQVSATGFWRRFRTRSGRLWCKARFRRRFRRRFREALVQSQVRFNRVPEKVPEKACAAFQFTETKLRCIEAAS